jgi:putative hydrolase of the HAD superfamily
MTPNIQAVLFDFGDTLMHSSAPWLPVFKRAGQALGEFLCANDINIECSAFSDEFRLRLDEYFMERERSLIETSSMTILQELLARKGYQDLSREFLRSALDRYYEITQQNWILEEDALSTLAALRSNGLQIGMVSNASDSKDVFELLDKFGIKHYFDFVLISADCGYRKPHPRIFELALSNWSFLPDEVAMVGDRLDADISGARPFGIYAIWIKRRARTLETPPAHPDATVHTLSEIPPLLMAQAGP